MGRKFEKLEQAATHAWLSASIQTNQGRIIRFVETNFSKAKGPAALDMAKAIRNISMNPDNSAKALKIAAKHLSSPKVDKAARKELSSSVSYAASHLNNGEINGAKIIEVVKEHYPKASKELKSDLAWALAKVAGVEKHSASAKRLAEKLRITL